MEYVGRAEKLRSNTEKNKKCQVAITNHSFGKIP